MSDTESNYSEEKPSKRATQKSGTKSPKKVIESKKSPQKIAIKKGKNEKTENRGGKANEKQPKKKKDSKPKEESSENETKALVLDYMQKQNRPYNLLNVFDNLHGKIKKAVLETILNELNEEGKLTCKQFGKNKVYFINQDALNVSKEAVDQLGKKYNELKTEQTELAQIYKKNLDNLKKLTAKKSVNEINQSIANYNKKIKELTKNKQKVMNLGSQKIDQKQVQAIEKEQGQLRKELAKRKKLTKQCLSTWSECLEKKVSQVAQLMGVQL